MTPLASGTGAISLSNFWLVRNSFKPAGQVLERGIYIQRYADTVDILPFDPDHVNLVFVEQEGISSPGFLPSTDVADGAAQCGSSEVLILTRGMFLTFSIQ